MDFVLTREFFFSLLLLLFSPQSHWRGEQMSERLVGAELLAKVNPPLVTNLPYGCVDHNVYLLIFGNLIVLVA